LKLNNSLVYISYTSTGWSGLRNELSLLCGEAPCVIELVCAQGLSKRDYVSPDNLNSQNTTLTVVPRGPYGRI
jgi:hypothetical protein